MRKITQFIDAQLNGVTMYKGILFGLLGVLTIADILAWRGAIAIDPLGLIIMLLVMAVSSYTVTAGLGYILKVPFNSESWLISAVILSFIITPTLSLERMLLAALCAAIAAASKYIFVWRGSHFLNPAAAGIFITSLTGILPGSWWVATPYLAPATILLAIIVLRKNRAYQLFFTFAVVAIGMLLFTGVILHGDSVSQTLSNAVLSWPIIFMGSIMLTEPTTLPASKYYQFLFAAIVGLIFSSQLHFGPFSSTPQAALIVGNLFALTVSPPFGAMLKLMHNRRLAPDIVELTFAKPAKLRYIAGQYMEWTLAHAKADVRGNRRTFSLSSAPSEETLKIAIKTYQPSSSYKKILARLSSGQAIRAANLAGNFTLTANRNEPLLFIAGGIGITPFRSMIMELTLQNQTRDIRLLYIASDEKHFLYKDVFSAAQKSGVKADYVIGQPNPQKTIAAITDLAQRRIYISGPDAMVTAYKNALLDHGITPRKIMTDRFTGY